MRYFLTIIFILTCSWTKSQEVPISGLPVGSPKITLTAKLGIPFGTIAKVEAQIFDGASLHSMGYQNVYLLKINYVNDKLIKENLLMEFTDDTGTLAHEDFGLYELIYKKKTEEITEEQLKKMKEKYVGKKLVLMAYETGEFVGLPDNYLKYMPITQDFGFSFQHHLVVVAVLKR